MTSPRPRSSFTSPLRAGLLAEIVSLAYDTLRANKLRSALTILGVVIGVTSIVAMTALIRGFGDQMHSLIRQMGSDTVYVQKLGFSSWASGRSFLEVLKRPNLTEEDAKAIREGAPSVAMVSMQLGGGPGSRNERLSYRDQSTKAMVVIGTSANFAETNYIALENGRFFTDYEVTRRRDVTVLGYAPASTLFPNTDPIGKRIRIGSREFTVVGTMGKRPSPLFGNPDEFAVIPINTYEKLYDPPRIRGLILRFLSIGVVPRPGVSREQVIREVEQVMRSRHRLKLDEENDFDIVTSDAIMKIVDQLTRAVVLALVVISSIALMVGGIGVERDRDPQGYRRAPRRDSRAVPPGSRVPDLRRRRARHPAGKWNRVDHQPVRGLPRVAAALVVRPWIRILGRGRNLLWPLPRSQSVAS
jgi:putative ABC transport system permease protein